MYIRKWAGTIDLVLVDGQNEIIIVHGDDRVVHVNGHCWDGKDAVLVAGFLRQVARLVEYTEVLNESHQAPSGIPPEAEAAALALVARDLAKFPRRPESAPWYDRVERDARNLPY